MKTKILTIALAVLAIGLLGSCKKEDPTISVMGVTLDKTTLTLTEGDNAQLVATVKPDNATDKSVSWKSDKTDVTTVDQNGNVHAVAPGTANITVITVDGAKTASCKVTVLENIDGALPGLFSVSATKKVRFSKGNLQAIFVGHAGISYSFRFAENQYDYIGNAPGNTTIESMDRAVVDLFGWSTDSNSLYGINTSMYDSDYSGNFRDWGNKIGDGNIWRTLSQDEWTYLFNSRTASTVNGTANARYAKATVNSKAGVILLPDTYAHLEGVAPLTNINTASAAFTDNTYDSANWAKMESAGAVFLPAAGRRAGSLVSVVGVSGFYWSSTAIDEYRAYLVGFDSSSVYPDYRGHRNLGFSVRLITESK